MASMIAIEEALIAKDTVFVDLAIIAFVSLFDPLIPVYCGGTAAVVHDIEFFHPLENGSIF